ncbi:MAG: sulfur carrier protein ThiS [Bacteroidetes bacterium]|nr:sulfur carrier protein ThiS [Bacteroidota bacterium]MBU2508704.1 sulfur carrier protein ThiS [Bacteroidota bacterium]
MIIVINGKSENITKEISIEELLKEKKIERPETIVVEINDEVLKRTSYGTTLIRENDRIELIYFMGGGH